MSEKQASFQRVSYNRVQTEKNKRGQKERKRITMAEAKKRLLTYAGLKALEDELESLKVVKRKEVAAKIKEAREQGDLSENAEYDASKDDQR